MAQPQSQTSIVSEPASQQLTAAEAKPRPIRRLLTRRTLLSAAAGVFGGIVGGAAYARYVEPFWAVLERHTLDLPNLPPAWHGRKLLHLTDLHISDIVPLDYLEQNIARGMAEKPDLVVITGDLLSRGDPTHIRDAAQLVGSLRAPFGVYVTFGNHEYGVSSAMPMPVVSGRRAAAALHAALTAVGARVLLNESVVIDGLTLVGLDDYWAARFNAPLAFQKVTRGPCIALSHNPDTIDDLRNYPCDWVLSGHTHGGQVCIPFIGPPLLPIQHRELAAGLFEVHGKRIYVSRGLGYIKKVRFNCRPELTLFTLAPRA